MDKKVSILTIGEEILFGQILNTNSNYISASLTEVGIKVVLHLSVGDNKEDIIDALKISESVSDIVIITGGLGPTNDDITKKSLADYFNCDLGVNKKAYKFIEDYFKRRGMPFSPLNQKQAELPECAEPIDNDMGTAPGMWIKKGDKIFISLPGVPHEMRNLIDNKIIPKLSKSINSSDIYYKMIMTAGIGESWLSEKIADWEHSLPANITVAYLPSFGQVNLRITAISENEKENVEQVNEQIKKLYNQIGKYIYGEDGISLEAKIGELLKGREETISLAESCTGGYLSHLVTGVPGSSDYYKGGIVAYENKVKERFLRVDSDVLNKYGAVSESVVKEMAEGIRSQFNTDYGIATSGIAGPAGGSVEKPVGTVWIAIADKSGVITKKLTILKDRVSNIKYSSVAALSMLWQRLSQNG